MIGSPTITRSKAAAIGLMVASACSGIGIGSGPANPCVQGTSLACQCSDGRRGALVCSASGKFAPCVCAGSSGTTGVSIGAETPALIDFRSATEASIGLSGAVPQPTSSTVTFQVISATGKPVSGVLVEFSVTPVDAGPGGSSISPPSSISDSQGLASTKLTSGTVEESVEVTAAVEDLSPAVSSTIAIGGGVVDEAHFSLSCDHTSIGGFQDDGLSMICTISASDQNYGFVRAPVFLLSEAGSVPSRVSLTENPGGLDVGRGIATFEYTTGCPWPADVLPEQDSQDFPRIDGGHPFTYAGLSGGEYFRTDSGFWNHCIGPMGELETRTVNPRDGWADLVAYTIGQTGDPLPDGGVLAQYDLGEPYLDINDNGRYDGPGSSTLNGTTYFVTGEPFFDHDNNRVWTPPDHRWHSNAAIWIHTRVVWTGTAIPQPLAAMSNISNNVPGFLGTDPPMSCTTESCLLMEPTMTHSSVCPGNPACSDPAGCGPSLYVIWADTNGNCPASDGAQDAMTVTCSGACEVAEATVPLTDCANFAEGGDSNVPGLPATRLSIQDKDCGCGQDPACPNPDSYDAEVKFTRTMDETKATQEVIELGVIGAFRNP